jgi:hypothetical protein
MKIYGMFKLNDQSIFTQKRPFLYMRGNKQRIERGRMKQFRLTLDDVWSLGLLSMLVRPGRQGRLHLHPKLLEWGISLLTGALLCLIRPVDLNSWEDL